MKKFIVLTLILMMTATLSVAQSGSTMTTTHPSSAERSIAEAQKLIQEKPAQYAGYNSLAMALLRRARETSDPIFYAQAEDAVRKSLQLAPKNFETEKIQVSILLGKHEFPAALNSAQALNEQIPDDVMVYGMLTEANAALGNYKAAETAAQWMLDLRPGNLPALINAAHLRELFGDVEGSYQLLEMAYASTPPTEDEERASLLTQMGHLRLATGNTGAAEKLVQQALTAFPNYPFAFGVLAEVRTAQGRYEDALGLLRQRYESVPRAENLYDLAQALRLANHAAEANRAFSEFATKSVLESDKKNNSNRQLIFYYADVAREPVKALKVATQEYSWRKDIYTLDAYAWALHVNGQDAEARKQIEAALAVGISDAKLLRHAGEIALKAGDLTAARSYLKQAAELNTPESEPARLALASLASTPVH